jgi:hypothetical protein
MLPSDQRVTLHRRGHHVQSAHGRRATLATDGSHLQGAMIALMPAEADAKRLAIKGGEAATDLHCTLFFLGDDASAWSTVQREELVSNLRDWATELEFTQVPAKVFGIAHWNAGGDSPSWVFSVGDAPVDLEGSEPFPTALHEVQYLASDALAYMHGNTPAVPQQHTPWVAHICAAYTADLSLAKELEKRLGPVTFDRIRVSFGDDDTDIPLAGGAVTASGIPKLRRDLTEAEAAGCCDFAAHQKDWEKQLDKMTTGWQAVVTDQRRQIENQVKAAVEADDLERLAVMAVDQAKAEEFLLPHLTRMAEKGAAAQRKEAEAQGVDVPEVDLGLTAAGVGDFIRSLARMTASITSGSLVQAAQRLALSLFGSSSSATAVADRVDTELAASPEADPVQQMGSALTAAQNEGRKAVLQAAPQADHYYASEILDKRTCKPCKAIDGHEFRTLEEASEAYPFGGYAKCKGLTRCRGTMFAVWNITETVVAAAQPEGGAMPWHVAESSECGADTPWAVIKDADDTVEGCHATEEEANQQMAALYAAEGESGGGTEEAALEPAVLTDDVPEMTGKTAPWEGVLAVEGIATGDGREFAADALTWGELPLPLRWNKEDSHGGEVRTVAVNVGRIDKVWREEEKIMASGVLNLAEADGQRAYDMIKGEFLRGVSIDADSIAEADVEFVWPEGAGEGDEDDPMAMLFAQPEKVIYHGGRIRAATLCDIPAFAEAYVALTDEAGAVVAGGQTYPDQVDEQRNVVRNLRTKARKALTASLTAVAEKPPASWFQDPKLSVVTGITVTDEGRVYGHAAEWESCHIGMDGVCTSPPEESYHAYYMTGELACEGGDTVAVGQITVGMGHAPLSYSAPAATEHYDNTDAVVADVAVGNDAHGIWVAGAVRPTATDAQIRALRAAGRVSGDWRRIGGKLRLVGLLTVNVPGFGFEAPKTRARAVTAAGGQTVQTALVAAGRLHLADAPMISEKELDQLAMHRVMAMLRERRG